MNQDKSKQKTKSKVGNKKTEKKPKPLTPMDIMKLEIAEELGLMDKINQKGWAGLTAAETGRIGGIMTSRIRKSKEAALK